MVRKILLILSLAAFWASGGPMVSSRQEQIVAAYVEQRASELLERRLQDLEGQIVQIEKWMPEAEQIIQRVLNLVQNAKKREDLVILNEEIAFKATRAAHAAREKEVIQVLRDENWNREVYGLLSRLCCAIKGKGEM